MAGSIPRKLWEGKIPAAFSLASYEVSSSKQPSPVYMMLPRSSYLSLFTSKMVEHFSHYMEEEKRGEVWFEFNGNPLRWHYPCGLLFDLHCDTTSDLPWPITVHFQNFPQGELIRCNSEKEIQAHYMSVIKEADQLKHKGQVINGMRETQHDQLWHGVKMDNFDEFWSINKQFMSGFETTDYFRFIPLRVYFQNRIIQKLFKPSNNENLTLNEALTICLPSFFANDKTLPLKVKVLTQGIEPPLTCSLQWLSENFSYADNFLHICVHQS
uniref:Autophagy protein 5 n=1 Tax=Ciona intestinalis TaxID=7719 RepID=Q3MQ22_CIOIN|nr:autophagy protein 5 [Ciona intestinalis]CAJ31265.1 autophagy protein 5 [Ciona intestinalis]|eukprot:NP_001071885.1 autophagy protein 5 [Ciona intestinalis]